ncbi:H/ACA RNA-protein complex component Cbf5p [Salinarchaeum sp. Harcht-Bsk1]|uniref:RNA-guided pseudouridylation complex pseudouridine synthase subunit Cbf5 n=1 Tax=Salinarchaeum sp. Harcht-Bsk1 TaxID=1333523 RepID=UPI0003423684|nr:RNA-guided pseudouridylation complex pseudouridine synthase subunit Cbf5 [Salinarchaeum sp. Harcht-Bsk1]AGN02693.1 H/ACA RNA-protein complex component Cbf5p [Salinarchaeum sp. Harcht-Bsk1]
MRGPPEERSDAELLSFGVVNLDKQPGPSAHEVAGWVRDAVNDALGSGELTGSRPDDPDPITGIDGAAHGGTLDPKVTGCLPTLLGDATRLAQVLHRGAKEYVAVLELHADPPTDLEAVVSEFEGPIYQKPPRKSAVKRQIRVREIYELDVLEVRDRQALLRIRCEGGTYVRKLCHDLGLALGTGAHMGHLRRTGTTPFDDSDLVSMAELVDALAYARETADASDGSEDRDPAPIELRDVVDPAERALENLPSVTIAPSAAEQVAEGAPVYAPGVLGGPNGGNQGAELEAGDAKTEAPLVGCYTPDDAVVCLGRLVGDPDADEGLAVELERVLV